MYIELRNPSHILNKYSFINRVKEHILNFLCCKCSCLLRSRQCDAYAKHIPWLLLLLYLIRRPTDNCNFTMLPINVPSMVADGTHTNRHFMASFLPPVPFMLMCKVTSASEGQSCAFRRNGCKLIQIYILRLSQRRMQE